MIQEVELRNQLSRMLTARQAHMDFMDAVAEFPAEHINAFPPNCTYSFWHLLEHLRICQRDILDYIVADDYSLPNFPNDLWLPKTAQTDWAGWQRTIDDFLSDRKALAAIINDEERDLFAPLPNSGENRHNVVREINIIANHNAYHTGEFAILRGVMGLWS